MAGSANTPPDANLAQALTQAGIAAFKVTGTGTSLDGKWVIGAMLIDPDSGVVYKAGGGTGGGAVTVADGADVTEGAKNDGEWNGSDAIVTAQSYRRSMATKLRALAAAVVSNIVQVAAPDVSATGTLTATQATANTPVAGGNVALALRSGQGTWAGQIIASNGGGLGSVLQFEYSEDGGTTWNSTSVRTSALAAGIGSSVALAGTTQTLTWRGSCAGWTNVRVRCSSYTASDVLAVSVTASVASDIPTGVAQDGTDSSDGNATQATAGVGIRGWLSTLVSLFRAGTAKVNLTAGTALIGKVGIDQTTPGTTNAITLLAAAATSATLQNAAGATGNGTPLSVAGMSVVVFTVGGASGPNATVTFEGTEDGTNYQSLIAANLGTGMQSGTASVTTTPTIYVASVGGLTSVRARISAWVAGTVTVTAHTTIAAYEPRVVQLSDGTTQLSVQAIASGQNAATVAGGFKEMAALSAGSLNADLVPSTDVSAYRWLSLHINTNAYSGTLTFQGSNDNSNFISLAAMNASSTGATAPASATSTTNAIFAVAVQFRFFRVRMTSYSSGAAQGTLEMYTTPVSGFPAPATIQSANWTVTPIPASGNGTLSEFHLIAAGSTNATSVKNGGGTIYAYEIYNAAGTVRFVKLFNKASAPTVGTDTPVRTICVPPATRVSLPFPVGLRFTTGIALCTTTGIADLDSAAVTASDLCIDIDYA